MSHTLYLLCKSRDHEDVEGMACHPYRDAGKFKKGTEDHEGLVDI